MILHGEMKPKEYKRTVLDLLQHSISRGQDNTVRWRVCGDQDSVFIKKKKETVSDSGLTCNPTLKMH